MFSMEKSDATNHDLEELARDLSLSAILTRSASDAACIFCIILPR